jgi:hypothetical protein
MTALAVVAFWLLVVVFLMGLVIRIHTGLRRRRLWHVCARCQVRKYEGDLVRDAAGAYTCLPGECQVGGGGVA